MQKPMNKPIPGRIVDRYTWLKEHPAHDRRSDYALEIFASDRIGLIADISSVVSSSGCNLAFMQSWLEYDGTAHILIQVSGEPQKAGLLKRVLGITSVEKAEIRPTYRATYGKRVIVLGGGAQVAQVALGAIAEADRHNIRGETISVDTIAIVGEQEIAAAVRGVGRLHRAAVLVLAGALMGGEISRAAQELREVYGIPVIALKMAGSIGNSVDLVVTDPVEAGVIAVMLISYVGKMDLFRIHGKTI